VRHLSLSDRPVRGMMGESTTAVLPSSSHSPTAVRADTMVRAVGAASPLCSLHVSDLEWTNEGLASIARGRSCIRSNNNSGDDPAFFGRMKETLPTHHNWTPQIPPVFWMFSELIMDIEWIRNVVSVTKTSYRVNHMAMWPVAMGMLSAKPTLLYRSLRLGNVDALSSRSLKPQGVPAVAVAVAASTPSYGRGVFAGVSVVCQTNFRRRAAPPRADRAYLVIMANTLHEFLTKQGCLRFKTCDPAYDVLGSSLQVGTTGAPNRKRTGFWRLQVHS
jgi:hypothetical protein